LSAITAMRVDDSRPRSFHAQCGRKECGGGGGNRCVRRDCFLRVADRVYSDLPINQVVKADTAAGDG